MVIVFLKDAGALTRRGTLREYDFPAVLRRDGRADDVRHLVAVCALIGDTYVPGKFAGQRMPFRRTGAQFEDTRVGFTRIRECFTLSVFDIQQPDL